MGLRTYLLCALAAFLIATVAADIYAQMTIAGEDFAKAFRDHFDWQGLDYVGALLLLVPFAATALICARFGKLARSRGPALAFALAMLVLLYFYFEGYLGAQRALLGGYWTAAALSVGLLPYFVGIPVVLTVLFVCFILAKLDRRPG